MSRDMANKSLHILAETMDVEELALDNNDRCTLELSLYQAIEFSYNDDRDHLDISIPLNYPLPPDPSVRQAMLITLFHPPVRLVRAETGSLQHRERDDSLIFHTRVHMYECNEWYLATLVPLFIEASGAWHHYLRTLVAKKPHIVRGSVSHAVESVTE